jgi:hypothetical protein
VALRRQLVGLEPVPEAYVVVAVSEHCGDHAFGVGPVEQSLEQAALEHAPGAVDELPSPRERRVHPAKVRSGAVNRKLVVFVPPEALDEVRDALFAAGAGRIGDYERCSWYTEGTGTFLGGEGTDPAIGEKGREERVPELRLETIFPEEFQAEVVEALRRAHPYEEPAFDVYPLA